MVSENEAQQILWDAVIVGTGLGGATLGYALAQAGWRVLFLERGRNHLTDPEAITGIPVERCYDAPGPARPCHRPLLERAGRCSSELDDLSRNTPRRFIPYVGCGTGGSSALYGMALERFHLCDFTKWPVPPGDMLPHYQTAEQLYRVRGSPDPLRGDARTYRLLPPPPLHPANEALRNFLSSASLHPYRLPMACQYEKGDDRCQGYLDAKGVRHDAATTCLRPALRGHGAQMLDHCTVQRLESTPHRATFAVAERHGRTITLRGRVFVLAAGALETPCLLLRSRTRHWPAGLANASGLVGKNLMRHLLDLYLVRADDDLSTGNLKELAFNDWYSLEGAIHGSVQSFGCLPPAGQLAAEWASDLCRGRRPWWSPALTLAVPLLRTVLQRRLPRCLVLASILEDSPRLENLVRPGSSWEAARVMYYAPHPRDLVRLTAFRMRMRKLLAPLQGMLLKQAENNRLLAHACGTCRFGDDPRSSVLDPFNRAHGLENLYAVDASFLPNSSGTNPGLTIAANALRVAEHLRARTGARGLRQSAGILMGA